MKKTTALGSIVASCLLLLAAYSLYLMGTRAMQHEKQLVEIAVAEGYEQVIDARSGEKLWKKIEMAKPPKPSTPDRNRNTDRDDDGRDTGSKPTGSIGDQP